MTKVTVEEAQRNLPRLIEDVALGEHVVIMKDQAPVAELAPVIPARRMPQFGSAKGMVKMSEDFDVPLEEFRDYMG